MALLRLFLLMRRESHSQRFQARADACRERYHLTGSEACLLMAQAYEEQAKRYARGYN